MNFPLKFIALLFMFCSTTLWAQFDSLGGLKFSVSGDMVGSVDSLGNYNFNPREAELMVYSPADYLFDGRLTLTAHNDEGLHVEVEELVLGSSKLIPYSRFRVGQFFLGFGRLNQFHRHDWSFVNAPRVHKKFFGEEGALGTGLEYSILLPIPFFLDLTLGVSTKYTLGHSHHDDAPQPYIPTHYARLANYVDIFAGGGLMTGLNYVGRRGSEEPFTTFVGLDLAAKWRNMQRLLFSLQSEVWFKHGAGEEKELVKQFGFYVYPEYGVTKWLYTGVGFDLFTKEFTSFYYRMWPTVTFKPSEFVSIRCAYEMESNAEKNMTHAFFLQVLFFLGDHPAHDF